MVEKAKKKQNKSIVASILSASDTPWSELVGPSCSVRNGFRPPNNPRSRPESAASDRPGQVILSVEERVAALRWDKGEDVDSGHSVAEVDFSNEHALFEAHRALAVTAKHARSPSVPPVGALICWHYCSHLRIVFLLALLVALSPIHSSSSWNRPLVVQFSRMARRRKARRATTSLKSFKQRKTPKRIKVSVRSSVNKKTCE